MYYDEVVYISSWLHQLLSMQSSDAWLTALIPSSLDTSKVTVNLLSLED